MSVVTTAWLACIREKTPWHDGACRRSSNPQIQRRNAARSAWLIQQCDMTNAMQSVHNGQFSLFWSDLSHILVDWFTRNSASCTMSATYSRRPQTASVQTMPIAASNKNCVKSHQNNNLKPFNGRIQVCLGLKSYLHLQFLVSTTPRRP